MLTTVDQAIKIGFLAHCAEEGLTTAETHARVKQAIAQLKAGDNVANAEKRAWLWPAAQGLGNAVVGGSKMIGNLAPTLGSLLGTGALVGVGAPVAAGAATGYLAAKLTNGDRGDALEDVKHDEIVSEYERLAEEAKRRALLKRVQDQTGKRIVPLSPSLGG